jgi:hypothetical protein
MVVASVRGEIDPFEQRNFRALAEELFPLIGELQRNFDFALFGNAGAAWFRKSSVPSRPTLGKHRRDGKDDET